MPCRPALRLSRPGPMPRHAPSTLSVVALSAWLTVGCAGFGAGDTAWREGGPRPAVDGPGDLTRARLALDPEVRDLPKSRIGNTANYTVFGQRYAVMESAAGFRETGIASWYGAKFHGRDTSSGERYDMHQMTAAHKHLPLPTFVRVTRTDTGQSIVVKVNDRGPFVDDRIIDLSFGAAARLGMLDSGTAPVSIEAVSTHRVAGSRPIEASVTRTRAASSDAPARSPGPDRVATAGSAAQWIQIGAFSDGDNARAALASAAGGTGLGGRVELDSRDALYRVRLGPLSEIAQLDGAIAALATIGVVSYTMVSAAH